jgi:hypothetical protein
VDDAQIEAMIAELVAEEHRLEREGAPHDAGRADRLSSIEVTLDRCWDLLRQRRARRSVGLDPDGAAERSAETVEGYEQ